MGTVNFNLQGQVAVITGASQGIGAACAERLSHDGAAVALWDVDDARGQALTMLVQLIRKKNTNLAVKKHPSFRKYPDRTEWSDLSSTSIHWLK